MKSLVGIVTDVRQHALMCVSMALKSAKLMLISTAALQSDFRRPSRAPFNPKVVGVTGHFEARVAFGQHLFGKMITRRFLVLHEAIVSRQSILSCAAVRRALR